MINQEVTWDEVGPVLEENFAKAVFAVAKELLITARDRTPIDTGFLSSQWKLSDNPDAPDVANPGGPFHVYDPAPDPVMPENGFETLYVLNPTEYAVFVEYGTVHMAPRLMLTLAAEEVQARIESIVAPYLS